MSMTNSIIKAALAQVIDTPVVTDDQAVDVVADAFEATCGDDLPTRIEAVLACMAALREVYVAHNRLCLTSQERWRVPKKPPLYLVFRLALLYEVFKRIATADGQSVVVMRDGTVGSRRYGVYSMNIKDMRRALRAFCKSLTDSDVNVIVGMIDDCLPLSEVCRDRDAIPADDGVFDYVTKRTEPWSVDSPIFLYKLPYSIPEDGLAEPVIIQPDGTPWTFTGWLPSIQPDDDTREAIWDVIGALLRPLVNWRVIVLLDGEGRNGKGSLVALLRALVGGPGNYATVSIRDFAKKENLSQLMHVSANIVDENDGSYVPSSEIIKAMADHNPLTMRQLYKDPVTMCPNAVNIQCCNELPRFKDKSLGLLSRIYDLPFKSIFIQGVNDNPAIKEDYLVRPEVVRWVAYHALVERPAYYMLRRTSVIEDALRDFRIETDSVAMFWSEEVMGNVEGCFLPYAFLHAWYLKWLRETNPSGHPEQQKAVTKRLKQLAAADGWVDSTGQRTCRLWMTSGERYARQYAKRRNSGPGAMEIDESDLLGRWYAYMMPARRRGLVLSAVNSWCAAHDTTPREFVAEHATARKDGAPSDERVTMGMIGEFVKDVTGGTIDPDTAVYEYEASVCLRLQEPDTEADAVQDAALNHVR